METFGIAAQYDYFRDFIGSKGSLAFPELDAFFLLTFGTSEIGEIVLLFFDFKAILDLNLLVLFGEELAIHVHVIEL